MTVAELKKLLDDYSPNTSVELRTYQDGHAEPYAVLVAMPYSCLDQIIYEEGGITHA